MKKEITDKEHRELLDLGYASGNRIADLIEYLGDDLDSILKATRYTVQLCNEAGEICFNVSALELVDILWEACLYKLREGSK